MKTLNTWLAVLVTIIFIGGAVGLVAWNQSRPPTSTPVGITDPLQTDVATYTASEVSQHTGAESCWTIINGNVYDLTTYVDKHPGGARAILGICGGEGTGSFNSMPASVLPAARLVLAQYKIGTLSQ